MFVTALSFVGRMIRTLFDCHNHLDSWYLLLQAYSTNGKPRMRDHWDTSAQRIVEKMYRPSGTTSNYANAIKYARQGWGKK